MTKRSKRLKRRGEEPLKSTFHEVLLLPSECRKGHAVDLRVTLGFNSICKRREIEERELRFAESVDATSRRNPDSRGGSRGTPNARGVGIGIAAGPDAASGVVASEPHDAPDDIFDGEVRYRQSGSRGRRVRISELSHGGGGFSPRGGMGNSDKQDPRARLGHHAKAKTHGPWSAT
ncbi:hypothetical protein Sjap_008720 [Stephania japonica]|uniref:Uncharacterized protein n=1 Tax=Stephania japonica TaxID=461633 RepID=A0AAP0JQ30_9MAGN